jgi:hypothetical protein
MNKGSDKSTGKEKETTTTPITTAEEINHHPDHKIDQDMPDFPHGHSSKKIISPSTVTEKKTADVEHTDGEKMTKESLEKLNAKKPAVPESEG